MKKLRVWLAEKNLSINQLADLLGVTREHLNRCFLGNHPFSKKMAEKIQEITEGLIKSDEVSSSKDEDASFFDMKCPNCGLTVAQIIESQSSKE